MYENYKILKFSIKFSIDLKTTKIFQIKANFVEKNYKKITKIIRKKLHEKSTHVDFSSFRKVMKEFLQFMHKIILYYEIVHFIFSSSYFLVLEILQLIQTNIV